MDDTEDLDLIMLLYNLLEYSSNYFDTTGRLWFILKTNQLYLMLILRIITTILKLSTIRLN